MIDTISGLAYLVVGFLFLQIIILIVDIYQVQKLNKFIPNKGLSIDKYHELKWRFNLFISIASVLLVTLGYLGFEINKSLDKQLTEYSNLSESYKTLSESVKEFKGLKEQGISIKKSLNGFETRLTKLQNENIGQSEIYSFFEVPLNLSEIHRIDTIMFSGLESFKTAFTNNFTKKPVINLIQYTGDKFNPNFDGVKIKKVTEKYVIFDWRGNGMPGSINSSPKTIDFWMVVDK